MVTFTRKLKKGLISSCLIIIMTLFIYPKDMAISQMTQKRLDYLEQQEKSRNKQKFPDQYSELDGNKTAKAVTDEIIIQTLESSRQTYLQALILIKRGDTLSAARYFQQAIDILNKLVSYPNIEKNEDFTDLAQSIVEDYESYITSIESLDENASLFIIRDKLFQEIEKMPAASRPSALASQKQSKTAYPYQLTNPDKMVVPFVDHELVDKNITFLTKNKKGMFFVKKCLERTGKWFPMMKRISELEGMPEELIYLSLVESGLDPIIVSKANAVGLWQFMRATGQDYKLNDKESFWVDERRDPEKATRAAMRHLRDLYYEFGDWHLSLAAYNCGTGCIRRAIRRSGLEKPTYWDIMKFLPKETSNYVPGFIATAKVIMHPEQYGVSIDDITFQNEYKYDLFQVTEPTNLNAIAKAAGISLQELKEYNPELLQNITPADRKTYQMKIPYSSLNLFTSKFTALSPDEKAPFIFHTVDRNESLKQIAKKYGVSSTDLVEVNNLNGYKAKIKRGDQLRIPIGTDEKPLLADKIDTSEPAKDAPTQQAILQTDNTNIGQIVTHTVQRGESIYSVANRYGIRPIDLRNLNNLSFDDDNIQVGQKLIIAKNKVTESDFAKAEAAEKPTIVKHKVARGETLSQIADLYGTSADEIKKQNNLRKNSVKKGQILKIATNIADENVAKSIEKTAQEKLSIHKVKRGESLSSIALQYGVTEDQLRSWNKKDINGSTILAGSRLKVQNNSSKSSASVQTKKAVSNVFYKVKSGDTLGSIAQKHGVSVSELKKNNRNISETRLQIGTRLKIK